jgi:hypothetical protein
MAAWSIDTSIRSDLKFRSMDRNGRDFLPRILIEHETLMSIAEVASVIQQRVDRSINVKGKNFGRESGGM